MHFELWNYVFGDFIKILCFILGSFSFVATSLILMGFIK